MRRKRLGKALLRAQVKRAWVHPNWMMDGIVNDAALLELSEPLDLDENIKPISLPEPYEEILRNDCAISGWGKLLMGTVLESSCWLHSISYSSK